jgi:F-type H+-transporting ATPase subunit epsilon
MADTIQLEIITSTVAPIKAAIKEIYIPAYKGEAGILEDHKPYISLLQPGEVNFTDIHGKKTYLYIRDGFVEVNDNTIVLISDSVEKGEDFNMEEIDAKLVELDNRIKALQDKDMSPEDLIAAPDKFAEALKEQTEFRTKRAIIQKLEK